jgi:hypothetical protein
MTNCRYCLVSLNDISSSSSILQLSFPFDSCSHSHSNNIFSSSCSSPPTIDIATIPRSFEWDTITGHAVLKAAGGSLINFDGTELQYGKPTFNNPCLMAHGRILDYEEPNTFSIDSKAVLLI